LKTYLECVPCFARQALEAARMASDSETVHQQVVRAVLRAAAEMDMRTPPPAMGQRIHRLIRGVVRDPDPYREVKVKLNRLALELYPAFEDRVAAAADPFDEAVRVTIAANVIDLGAKTGAELTDVRQAMENALAGPLDGDTSRLADAAARAHRILYLADNAGEIVFDRLLIERLPTEKVTLVVKGSPVINDATREDAEVAGLADLVEVIDNGSDAPGTLLESCSPGFLSRAADFDLVLAKGQANYETLSDRAKHLFFLLLVKCDVLARDLEGEVGSLVVREKRPGMAAAARRWR
jgi:hypothetical protein